MKGQRLRASKFLRGPLHCTTLCSLNNLLALIQTEIQNCVPQGEPTNILQKRSYDKSSSSMPLEYKQSQLAQRHQVS